MKKIIALVSLVLAFILLGSSINVFAEETDDYIYYTDLFYAYPHYLTNNSYLNGYVSSSENTFDTVFNNYKNSPEIIGTALEEAMDRITSTTDIVKTATDVFGLTNFDKNEAIDTANQKFVTELMCFSDENEYIESFGKTEKIVEGIKTVNDYFNLVQEEKEPDSAQTVEYYLGVAFDYLYNAGYLNFFSQETLYNTWLEIHDEDFKLNDAFDFSNEIIKATKGLFTALLIENVRMEIVDEIIASTDSDTILYQGMSRLKSQLSGGWITYFLDAYVKTTALEKICECFDDAFNEATGLSVPTKIIKMIKLVVFNFIVDVPSYDEVMAYKVLQAYSYDLKNAIYSKAKIFFQGLFLSDSILEYEALFKGYIATNNAAAKILEEIVEKSDPCGINQIFEEAREAGVENVVISGFLNVEQISAYATDAEVYDAINQLILKSKLLTVGVPDVFIVDNGVRAKTVTVTSFEYYQLMNKNINESYDAISAYTGAYTNSDVYQSYISNIKSEIMSTSVEERVCIDESVYKDWTYNINSYVRLMNASNVVESGCIYEANGIVKGNIVINYGALIVPKGVVGKIDGDLTIEENSTVVINGELTVAGTVKLTKTKSSFVNKGTAIIGKITNIESYPNNTSNIENYGYLEVKNDVSISCGSVDIIRIIQLWDTAVFAIGGNFYLDQDVSCEITKGIVRFIGDEVQSVSNLKAYSVEIDNPAGIKYGSNIYVNGLYDTKHNPIDVSDYVTVISNTTSFIEEYDYKTIKLSEKLELNKTIKGNIVLESYNAIVVPEGAVGKIDGELTIGNYSTAVIYGELTVTSVVKLMYNSSSFVNKGNTKVGHIYMDSYTYSAKIENYGYLEVENDMKVYCSSGRIVRIIQSLEDSVLAIGGNFILNTHVSCEITKGIVRFIGDEVQSVSNLKAYSVEIDNPAGIKYNTDIYVNGLYDTKYNPIDVGNFATKISNTTSFIEEYDYKTIKLSEKLELNKTIKGNMVLENYGIVVPERAVGKIDGELTIGNYATAVIYGELTVTGVVKLMYNSSSFVNKGNTKVGHIYMDSYTYSAKIENYGYLEVENDMKVYCSYGRIVIITQLLENAVLAIGGNFSLNAHVSCEIVKGVVRFIGDGVQSVSNLKAPKIIIENQSEAGVVFKSAIYPWMLLDHQGNNFTLYNNGIGSTFVDYDGDGLKDNVDPEPTVGNPCVLDFTVNDSSFGSVSIESIETIGGTEITVTATPTFKYEFFKWINSSGKTVSTYAESTFVAKGDETYTAVFVKRSQPITVVAEGGNITVPSIAEIESKVSVSVTEKEGYIYTDGSLKYNDTVIENGTFIMPDEAVVITADFVRNEWYFTLKEKIAEAKAYTYESYSAESFAKLQSAIESATASLYNHITEAESTELVELLQQAIDGLEAKYFVSVKVTTIPALYVGVEDCISGLIVTAYYDNGTSVVVDGFNITGYDYSVPGEQSVTVTYEGLSDTFTANVIAIETIEILTEASTLFYEIGDEFTADGLTVQVCYADGYTVVLEADNLILSGYDSTTEGIQTISVSYGNATTAYSVRVIKADNFGIELKTSEKTSVSQYVATLGDYYQITAYKDGSLVDVDTILGTGMTVKIINTLTSSIYYQNVIVSGDVNGDGKVTTADYMKIKASILKPTLITDAYFIAADLNGDGVIKTADYMKVRRHINGTYNIYEDLA